MKYHLKHTPFSGILFTEFHLVPEDCQLQKRIEDYHGIKCRMKRLQNL